MEYGEDKTIDFETWYIKYRSLLPKEFVDYTKEHSYEIFFMFQLYRKVMAEIHPSLRKLMNKQYPVFKTENRPLVTEYINNISATTGHELLFKLIRLVQGQKNGVNVREKYPKFDRWVDFYGRPQKPKTIDEATRSWDSWMSDEEWIIFRDSENKALLEYFNWKEKRKFEFIDLIQTILFKYYKELEDLNPDEWIIYAVDIRDEYEYYLTSCEDVELFIDCGFPDDYIKLTNEQFRENYSKLNMDIKQKATELRKRRIAGEMI